MTLERAQYMMVLSSVRLRSAICTSDKSQKEIAEWCWCSDRQIRNWIREDTNVGVSFLYSLADCLDCRPEDLLIAAAIPEGRE